MTKDEATSRGTAPLTTTVATTTVDGLEIGSDLTEPFIKGTVQAPEYRDLWAAYAFVVQLVGVFVTTAVYAPAIGSSGQVDAQESSTNGSDAQNEADDEAFSAATFWTVLAGSFLAAFLSNVGLLSLMMQYTTAVVQISFVSAPLLLCVIAIAFAALGDTDPDAGTNLFGVAIFFAIISAMVYLYYRKFIPFASSTLRSALSAIRFHRGLYLLSFGSLLLSFVVSIIFVTCLVGIFANASQKGQLPCQELYPENSDLYQSDDQCMVQPPNSFLMLLLFLCFVWTQQVIQNVLHVTTAGTVGTWWFSGLGDPSFCSRDMTECLGRAMTYSFGSICFGSLLVAIVQTLQQMARNARHNRRGALLACVLECLLYCIRSWLEYFNSWAFCYIGLYGYDYITAGKNVVQLFKSRGWSSFASDRLIFRVLYASQLTIALVSGGVAALVDAVSPSGSMFSDDKTASHTTCFFMGLLLGLFLAKCSLFVIESAVRTVIICFAESPADFKEHHPELCQEMRDGWAAAYPTVWVEEYDLRFSEATSEKDQGETEGLLV